MPTLSKEGRRCSQWEGRLWRTCRLGFWCKVWSLGFYQTALCLRKHHSRSFKWLSLYLDQFRFHWRISENKKEREKRNFFYLILPKCSYVKSIPRPPKELVSHSPEWTNLLQSGSIAFWKVFTIFGGTNVWQDIHRGLCNEMKELPVSKSCWLPNIFKSDLLIKQ